MKTMKRRILMMLMAMMAVISLIGCGNQDNNRTREKTTSVKTEKTQKKEKQENEKEIEELEEETEDWEDWEEEWEETEDWKKEVGEGEETDMYALYDYYLTEEAPEILMDSEEGEYGFYDVDQDGIDELILREPGYLYIIQYIEGELVNVYPDGAYSDLLENGMVRYYRPGGAPENENYAFYTLVGDEYLEEVSLAWYDNEEDENGTYDEEDNYEIDGEEVTMEEWMDLLDEYLYYDEADITFLSL